MDYLTCLHEGERAFVRDPAQQLDWSVPHVHQSQGDEPATKEGAPDRVSRSHDELGLLCERTGQLLDM